MIRQSAMLLLFLSLFLSVKAGAQALELVGEEWPTYVEYDPDASRLTNLVSAMLDEADVSHNIDISTLSMSVSGLKAGRYEGYIDQLSILEPRDGFIYSEPFFTHHLHIVSKNPDAVDITSPAQLRRERVGVVRRFSDSDRVRSFRDIRWARVQSDFDNFRQLADDRVNYMLADRLQVEEFNLLLKDDGEELLYVSRLPLISLDVRIGLKSDAPNAQSVIERFNPILTSYKLSGQVNQLMQIPVLLVEDDNRDIQLVTSAEITPSADMESMTSIAYPLSLKRRLKVDSFNLDGSAFSEWSEVQSQLQARDTERPSLLDAALYKPLIDAW